MEEVLNRDISEIRSDMLRVNDWSIDEFIEVAHHFGLEIPHQINETDTEYKTILKDIIIDRRNATLDDIKRNIQACKIPQRYEESEIAQRYIWGLKILRVGQVTNGPSTQKVKLRTLLPIPSKGSPFCYGKPIQVTADQCKRMAFTLMIMSELHRMGENLPFRTLVYYFQIFFKVRERKVQSRNEIESDDDEDEWENAIYRVEFGTKSKINMKKKSACVAATLTLKNLSTILGLPKLTNPLIHANTMYIVAPFSLIKDGSNIDLSKGWWGADHQTLRNTLHIHEGSHYSIVEGSMSNVKGIILIEKLAMLFDLYCIMSETQRDQYILMTSRGFRCDTFLYTKRMFQELAGRKLEEFVVGDADLSMLKMALSMEKIEIMPMVDQCFYYPVKVVSPFLYGVNDSRFTGLTDAFKYNTSGKRLKTTHHINQINKWLETGSPMLENQSRERKKILRNMKRDDYQYQVEIFEKEEIYDCIMSYIDSDQ